MKKFFALFLLCSLLLLSFIACENNANGNNENETIKNGNDTNGDSGDVGSTEKEDNDNTQGDVDSTEKEYNNDTSSGNSNSDFEYEFSSTGKYVYITKYIGESEDVVIPSKIEGCEVSSLKATWIPSESFGNEAVGVFQNSNIKTIVIPETIRGIGESSFKNCTSLSSVTIQPNSELLHILSDAFENCTSLKTINLEAAEKLTTIEPKAFSNCSSIEKITLPKNLEEIGSFAFENCASLKSITIPANLRIKSYDAPRFHELPSLEKIIFEEGREAINGYAYFQITSEAEIIIPKSVKTFESDTFFIYAPTKFTFLGDCPENELTLFAGEQPITICYDPDTNGWDTCIWKDKYTFVPIE